MRSSCDSSYRLPCCRLPKILQSDSVHADLTLSPPEASEKTSAARHMTTDYSLTAIRQASSSVVPAPSACSPQPFRPLGAALDLCGGRRAMRGELGSNMREIVDGVYRSESRRVFATLIRLLG